MRGAGTAWRWWRARSRKAKTLVVAVAVVLLAVALPAEEQADVAPVAAEAAEQQPATPPAATREGERNPEPEPAGPATNTEAGGEVVAVSRVIDGDTIRLANGSVVRLVQIDAPELRGSECYAHEATETLRQLLPVGIRVRIETDPALDRADRYDRQLAYVFKGGENVNRTLVLRGAASVWFYRGARGRYADALLAAAREAEASGRGLWGACEATLAPHAAVSTAPRAAAPPAPSTAPAGTAGDGECHPAYDPCLPVVGDVSCAEVRALGQAPVRVKARGNDPYRLDGDGDGVGCE